MPESETQHWRIRFLNSIATCYSALRIAGFSPEDAERIVREEAINAVNRIPTRPYPKDTDHAN